MRPASSIIAGAWVMLLLLATTVPVPVGATPEAISACVGTSDSLAVVLAPLPPRHQDLGGSVLQYFTASADSTFLWGPNRPNPYSWLHSNIVGLEPFDFELAICAEDGTPIDTVKFAGVEPGVYRMHFVEPGQLAGGIYWLRYNYKGEVVFEHKISHGP